MATRQVSILPAGSQKINNQLISFTEQYIIYCSIISVYVLNATTYEVLYILNVDDYCITSISVNPFDNNSIAVCGRKGNISIWDIPSETIKAKASINENCTLYWDLHYDGVLRLLKSNVLSLYEWVYADKSNSLIDSFKINQADLVPTCLRQNKLENSWIAIGTNSNQIFFYNCSKKKIENVNSGGYMILSHSDTGSVIDLQWDRLSSSYILALYTKAMILWDVEAKVQLISFDKQPVDQTGIAWMDWTAGGFITYNRSNSIIKVWNASQTSPLDSIKTRIDAPIHEATFFQGKGKLLLTTIEGSMAIYDVKNQKIDFSTQNAHSDTIFRMEFQPNNADVVATVSADKFLKIWNTQTMTLTRTVSSISDSIYCLSWSPCSKFIAASTYNGLVVIIDVYTGREIARYFLHSNSAYTVSWNKIDRTKIISGGGDGIVHLLEVDTKKLIEDMNRLNSIGSRKKGIEGLRQNLNKPNIIHSYRHDSGVFGAYWHPSKEDIFSVSLKEGLILIYDATEGTIPIFKCVSHQSRVFTSVWSPILENLLASTSDDTTVRIWNIDLGISEKDKSFEVQPFKILKGHTNNVRAISWNYEYEHLLITGSWDKTIKFWDVKSGVNLYTLSIHTADVYSIISHPLRPFVYLSSSRDISIRVWELQGIFSLFKYYTLWDGNFNRCLKYKTAPSLYNIDDLNNITNVSNIVSPIAYITKTCLKGEESTNMNNLLLSKKMLTNDSYQSQNSTVLPPTASSSSLGLSSLVFSLLNFNNNNINNNKSFLYDRTYCISLLDQIDNFMLIYNFYHGYAGYLDLFENLFEYIKNLIINNIKSSMIGEENNNLKNNLIKNINNKQLTLSRLLNDKIILTENEIVSSTKSIILKNESNKLIINKKNENNSQKVEDILLQTANLYVKLGNFQKYCEIMIDLGKWETALAIAPSVSYEYWKSLSLDYANYLANKSNENSVPFYMASGYDGLAVSFYLKRNEDLNALLVAKTSENRKDLIPNLDLNYPGLQNNSPVNNSKIHIGQNMKKNSSSSNFNPTFTTRERTINEMEASRNILNTVVESLILKYNSRSQPILSAAYYISINNIDECLNILTLNCEYDLAYFIALCCNHPNLYQYTLNFADLVFKFGDINLVLEIVLSLRNYVDSPSSSFVVNSEPESKELKNNLNLNEIACLYIFKFTKNIKEINELLAKYKLTPINFSPSSAVATPLDSHLTYYSNKLNQKKLLGLPSDIIKYNLLLNREEEVVDFSIHYFYSIIESKKNILLLSNHHKNFNQNIKFLNIKNKQNSISTNKKKIFYYYLLWFNSYESISLNLLNNSSNFLTCILDNYDEIQKINGAISSNSSHKEEKEDKDDGKRGEYDDFENKKLVKFIVKKSTILIKLLIVNLFSLNYNKFTSILSNITKNIEEIIKEDYKNELSQYEIEGKVKSILNFIELLDNKITFKKKLWTDWERLIKSYNQNILDFSSGYHDSLVETFNILIPLCNEVDLILFYCYSSDKTRNSNEIELNKNQIDSISSTSSTFNFLNSLYNNNKNFNIILDYFLKFKNIFTLGSFLSYPTSKFEKDRSFVSHQAINSYNLALGTNQLLAKSANTTNIKSNILFNYKNKINFYNENNTIDSVESPPDLNSIEKIEPTYKDNLFLSINEALEWQKISSFSPFLDDNFL